MSATDKVTEGGKGENGKLPLERLQGQPKPGCKWLLHVPNRDLRSWSSSPLKGERTMEGTYLGLTDQWASHVGKALEAGDQPIPP